VRASWRTNATPLLMSEEVLNSTWESRKADDGLVFSEYDRPVYFYVQGFSKEDEPQAGNSVALVYTGLRWQVMGFAMHEVPEAQDFWEWQMENFHAFWFRRHRDDLIIAISDPTTGYSPVGVDFYRVEDRGSQFGPFGSLVPMQLNNQIGRGVFRCDLAEDDICDFCSNGITTDNGIVVSGYGETCGSAFKTSKTIEKVSKKCKQIKMYLDTCCPEDARALLKVVGQNTTVKDSNAVEKSDLILAGKKDDEPKDKEEDAVG